MIHALTVETLTAKYHDLGLLFTSPFEGLEPVQAYGEINNQRFYFRLRGKQASLIVGKFNEQSYRAYLTMRNRLGDPSFLPEMTEEYISNEISQYLPTQVTMKSEITWVEKQTMEEIFSELVENLSSVKNDDDLNFDGKELTEWVTNHFQQMGIPLTFTYPIQKTPEGHIEGCGFKEDLYNENLYFKFALIGNNIRMDVGEYVKENDVTYNDFVFTGNLDELASVLFRQTPNREVISITRNLKEDEKNIVSLEDIFFSFFMKAFELTIDRRNTERYNSTLGR